ncbi:MAG: glutathione synthase, partial [Candidatus Puniceispirillaceae bacterium]
MTTRTLSFAIQMDPVASIDIAGDSTFALGLEAQSRGHDLWYYTPDK